MGQAATVLARTGSKASLSSATSEANGTRAASASNVLVAMDLNSDSTASSFTMRKSSSVRRVVVPVSLHEPELSGSVSADGAVGSSSAVPALSPSFSPISFEGCTITQPSLLTPPPTDVIFHPVVLAFLSPKSVGALALLCKAWDPVTSSEGYWRSLCASAATSYSLFLPRSTAADWRKLFFDHIWPARNKWTGGLAESDFNIQVAVRFKPGTVEDVKLVLPLHQRLRMRKAGEELVSKEPAHFLDALMSTVMTDPVKLPSSGAVMDRAIILVHLKRAPRDPFTQAPLSPADLIPLPDLKKEIQAWRVAKPTNRDAVSVSASALGALVSEDGGDLPVEIMEALIEAEKLNGVAKRAEEAASATARARRWRSRVGEQGPAAGAGGEEFEDDFVDEEEFPVGSDENVEHAVPSAASEGERRSGAAGDDIEEIDEGTSTRYKESPKVLAVQNSRVVTYVPGAGVRPFLFTRVFDPSANQAAVYTDTAHKVVVDVLNGFNACLLCYGQTGSGKTYTMFGPDGELARLAALPPTHVVSAQDTDSMSGLAVRAVTEVLALSRGGNHLGTDPAAVAAANALAPVTANISLQYLEIYQNSVTDLLTGRPVQVSAFGPNVVLAGALDAHINEPSEAYQLLQLGDARKQRAATAMNERSSRAHTILLLTITQRRADSDALVRSHLYLVDLAGSERLKKSKAAGVRKTEAVGINQSLLVLGKCIAALVEGKHHVPYNECKLTMILKAAFGGNSRTTAIVTAHTDDSHADETLQSLRFGERCSMVTNTTVLASTSVSGALTAIDTALSACSDRIAALEQQGRTHLEVYSSLVERFEQLKRRRREIQAA